MTQYRTHLRIRGSDNERLRTVMRDIHTAFGRDLPAAEKNAHDLLGFADPLLGDFDVAIGRVRGSELTLLREAKDEERDTFYLGLAESIGTGTRHFDSDKRAAAGRLLTDLSKRESGFQRASYDENTAELNLLFLDLDKPAAQADLQTLGLEEWYARLKTANAEFEELQRTPVALPDLPRLRPIKRELARTFGALLTLGEAYALKGIAPWQALMLYATDRINTLHRYGNNSGAAPSDDQGDDDPEPEAPEPISA